MSVPRDPGKPIGYGRDPILPHGIEIPGMSKLLGAMESRRSRRASVREAALYEALRAVCEVTADFLTSEYPVGTDHPADAEAARLARAYERAQEVLQVHA